MRKLATIRRIDELLPIEGADLILLAKIDGWQCVVKKVEFKVGDLCVYFEIDSFLPDGYIGWQHLVDKSSRIFEGKKGHRLKTIKLRGQLSQGFAMPVPEDLRIDIGFSGGVDEHVDVAIGQDVTDLLGIKKYEKAVPTELAGQVKGNFPGWIKKTDQERCQNMKNDIFIDNANARYEISMKLDGTSFTAYTRTMEVEHGTEPGVGGQMAWADLVTRSGVCGRNWELKTDDPTNENNSLVRMFIDSGLRDVMQSFGRDFAIQGELMGPGIQQNRERFAAHRLYIFDIFNISTGRYITPHERHRIVEELWERGVNREMVHHVPVLHLDVSLQELGLTNVDQLLAFAEGNSINHAIREGLVYKRMDGGFSFKTISNKFLLKEED